MKVDSVPGGVRRRPLIRSSIERWKRESINEGPAIDSILRFLPLCKILCMQTCSRHTEVVARQERVNFRERKGETVNWKKKTKKK